MRRRSVINLGADGDLLRAVQEAAAAAPEPAAVDEGEGGDEEGEVDWEELPPPALANVLAYLEEPLALCRARRVCALWRDAASQRCEVLAEPSHLLEQPDLGPEAGEGHFSLNQ